MKTQKFGQRQGAIASVAPRAKRRIFAVHRTVAWGDCDPAGFIYTPRVFDYACETVDAWFREVAKVSWWQLKSKSKGAGLPTVNAVCDFISIVRPDQKLQLNMTVTEIGKSSIVFNIEGLTAGHRPAFRVKMVSCAVDMATNRPTPIPRWMRSKLEIYKSRKA